VALSDACAEFIWDIEAAIKHLAELVEHYSGRPTAYGIEIGGLRKACADAIRDPDDHTAVARLMQLAVATRRAHDAVSYTPEWNNRHEKMRELAQVLAADVGEAQAHEIIRLLPAIATDTPQAVGAAQRLKELLPRLGKAAYDIAIKVISDLASETAKKILGLK